MKIIVLLYVCAFFAVGNCAKILAYFYFPSVSHQIVFQTIVTELSLKGHEVTYVTTDPIKNASLTNLTEVDISEAYRIFEKYDLKTLLDGTTLNLFEMAVLIQQFTEDINTLEMNVEGVKEILKQKEGSYDLILIEEVNVFFNALQHKFKAPVIAISSFHIEPFFHELLGNPIHPFIYPSKLHGPLKLSNGIWLKFRALFTYLTIKAFVEFNMYPRMTKQARLYFGEDMPDIKVLAKNTSLVIGNMNPILSWRRALVPNVKEIWNIHPIEKPTVPQDLLNIMNNATNGFVYFSLGTNVRFNYIEDKLKMIILKALQELPFTVICKWELNDHLNVTKNVIMRKWLPQRSILAHPNLKLFVTQAGVQSSEEAIINGVPLVIIPFFGDQLANAKILTDYGMARTIYLQDLNVDILKNSILEVASNEKYRKEAAKVRDIFFDQPEEGAKQVVWWCEYVMRHKGATHLKSPSADYPFYEYYFLDIGVSVIFMIYIIYFIIKKCSLYLKQLMANERILSNKVKYE